MHIKNKRGRLHTCYRDDIFSVYALCIYTLSIFHSLSVWQALDIFVALAKHAKEKVPTRMFLNLTLCVCGAVLNV